MATEYEWKRKKNGTIVLTAKKETDKKKIKRLEKENKSLKDDLLHYIQREEEYRKEIDKLKIEIWWLMWERDGLKMVVERLHKEIEEQDEEIKKLKCKWEWEIWDKKTNNPIEVISWLIVEKAKLEERNQTLELWLDNKEKLNEEYRKQIDKLKSENEYRNNIADIIPEWEWHIAEETIKDLQDRIKELEAELDKYKDDIIYEEWLYD